MGYPHIPKGAGIFDPRSGVGDSLACKGLPNCSFRLPTPSWRFLAEERLREEGIFVDEKNGPSLWDAIAEYCGRQRKGFKFLEVGEKLRVFAPNKNQKPVTSAGDVRHQGYWERTGAQWAGTPVDQLRRQHERIKNK